MGVYRDWVWTYILLLLGTIHILRKHLFSRKLNLTFKFFSKTGFFCQNKRISFSTLHLDKIFKLKFEYLKHREETNGRKIHENDLGDKKKCLRDI